MIELVLGFILGWLIAIMYLSHAVKQAIIKISAAEKLSAKTNVTHTLFLEEHNSILYAWDDSSTFVTQGASIEEVISDLFNRLEMKKVVLVTDSEMLFITNGEIFARKARSAK